MLHQMYDCLLDSYEFNSEIFRISKLEKYVITKEDVYDVFMLSCKNKRVDMKDQDPQLVATWREHFRMNGNAQLKLGKAMDKMEELADGGDLFKRLFVLFALGSFLTPQVHKRIDHHLFKAVENVGDISKLDWCGYVIDRLNEAANHWRMNDQSSASGCLLFLQLTYFHRLTWRGVPALSTLPLLQHWTYEDTKERIEQDATSYALNKRVFGFGVLDTGTYPVSRGRPKIMYREGGNNEVSGVRNARSVTLPLHDDLMTDAELEQKYHNDIVKLGWNTTLRNLEVVSRLHQEMALNMETKVQQGQGNALDLEGGELGEGLGVWTQCFNDPAFMREWDSLCHRVDNIRSEFIEPPSFILGIEDLEVREPQHAVRNVVRNDQPKNQAQ